MALPATEDFAGTGALSASWTSQIGTVQRSAGVGKGAGGTENFSYWNADTFNDNQYSQCNFNVDNYPAVSARASGTGAGVWNAYLIYGDTAPSITEYVNGTQNNLQTLGAVAANALVKIEVSGTTIKAFYDGVQNGTDQTDNSLASGSAGVGLYNTVGEIDNWEGGNLAGGAAPIRIKRLMRMGMG